MRTICVDSCFLLGVYDENDQYHDKAPQYYKRYFEDNKVNSILIPWPIVYETLRTTLTKHIPSLTLLLQDWIKFKAENRLILCNDAKYREDAFEEYRSEVQKDFARYRPLSLADRVIRSMLKDKDLRISALLTFNLGDFADICKLTNCNLIQ